MENQSIQLTTDDLILVIGEKEVELFSKRKQINQLNSLLQQANDLNSNDSIVADINNKHDQQIKEQQSVITALQKQLQTIDSKSNDMHIAQQTEISNLKEQSVNDKTKIKKLSDNINVLQQKLSNDENAIEKNNAEHEKVVLTLKTKLNSLRKQITDSIND